MTQTRIYCRASTAEQHADRALHSLQEFAKGRGWEIAAEYVENASGASIERPELTRLLSEAQPGDVLLIESVDRLSRLTDAEWSQLKRRIDDSGLLIAVQDVPTSWELIGGKATGATGSILRAVNTMMIDILASMARVDYETRRARQLQGIERAKAQGKYKGSEKDAAARETVRELLAQGVKPAHIMAAAGISRATYYRIIKELSA